MNSQFSTDSNESSLYSSLFHILTLLSERWASLLGRLLILFGMVYCPLVFFTWTWRHYHLPKVASFQWLMMLLIVCWGIIAVRHRFVRSALATPVAFFFAIVMLTSLVSVNLSEAWESITFILACMVFLVMIPKFLTKHKDLEILVYLFGLMTLMVDIYALGQWFDWVELFQFTEKYFGIDQLTPKPVSFMGNENYAAEFLNMALPVCFAMMIASRRKPIQLIFFSLLTLLNSIVMVYIDCNASFAGFIVAIPISAILLIYFKAIPFSRKIGLFYLPRMEIERRFRYLLFFGLLWMSIFATLIAVFPNSIRSKMASMATWMDVDGDLIPDGVAPVVFRLQCMDAASRNITDSPIWGIGAGNFKVLHPLYESQLERKVLGEETLARKVHNDHLYHAVEFGIFGLLGWYWIIAATFYAIVRSMRLVEYQSIAESWKENKPFIYHGLIDSMEKREFYFYLQWGILTALIIALVSCAFGHTFVISSGTIIFWLLCGVGVSVYQNLLFASRGFRNTLLGVTPESLTPLQNWTRSIPGFVWGGVFCLAILPLGVLNTNQLIGETWLRQGMSEKDARSPNYYGMFKSFEKSLDYYPYQMETFYILGRYYIDAVVDLETAMLSGKDDLISLYSQGLSADKRQQYNQEGIAILQADIFMNPNYKWAHNNLGVLYDRYYDSIKPDSEPGEIGPLFQIAPNPEQAAAVMQGSKETYGRVLAIDEEQIYAHFNLGLGYIKLKQYDKAIEPLNRALITDPSRYDIYKYLSTCYNQNREYKRALRATEKYLEKVLLIQTMKRMQKSRDRSNYEQILQSLREEDYAKAATQARLIFQWEDKEIYQLYIAIATEMMENYADQEMPNPEIALTAVEMAEKVNATPKPESYLWHAKIYEQLSKYENAAENVEAYLRIRPDDDEMRHSLMLLYVTMNDLPRAQKTMAVLVEKEPDNWKNLITYARLLAGLNTPWLQVSPYVERSIQIGGDEARRFVIEDQPGNLLLPYVKQDSRILELLGPSFLPESTSQLEEIPQSATGEEPLQPVPNSEEEPASNIQSGTSE